MSNRGTVLRMAYFEFVVEDCSNCGVTFAIDQDLRNRRMTDRGSFYCPNGHGMHYTGKTDSQKLKEQQARTTALQDQLDAAVRDAETVRQSLARDRHRFFNGVCPCCNRSFDNVRRHMLGQHPDYEIPVEAPFECSCGATFSSYRGLRSHQGSLRRDEWERAAQDPQEWRRWRAHLTVV